MVCAWGRLATIDLTTLARIWGTRSVSTTARVHRITPDFLVWGFAPRFCFYSLRNICVTNDHGYVPLVGSASRSFPHAWLITGFVLRVTWLVSLAEQELVTLPENLNSSQVFSGVPVARSLVVSVVFCRSLFVLLSFFIWAQFCLSLFELRNFITHFSVQTLLH